MEQKQPIRIAHIMGKWGCGGVESFVMSYYRKIDKNKIQFDFICDKDSTNIPYEEIKTLGGHVYLVEPYQKIFKYTKDLKKIFLQNNYKIVHSHLNSLSVFPLYCAWKAHIPVRIAHSHSTSTKKEYIKNIIKLILRLFSKVFATHYFACSENAGKWLFGNRTFENGKVTIIHNAIDIDKFKYNENIRNDIRKEMNIEDKFVIGHVGRFMKQKNHDFMIDVFSKIHKKNSNTVLFLIGDGPLEENIKNKVKSLNLEKSVYFLGVRNDVNNLMQAMDTFLFPSLYEGLGIVLIEAQCAGLPCIVSTEVPKEAEISNLIQFCTLSNIEEWLKIDWQGNHNREKCFEFVKESEYEITLEVEKLENKYFDLT